MIKHEYIRRAEEFIKEGLYKEIRYDYTNKYQAQIKKTLKGTAFINDKQKYALIDLEAPKFKYQVKLYKNKYIT